MFMKLLLCLVISNQDTARNNGFKIEKSRFKKEIRKKWFSNWVVDEWNVLTNQVICANTIESFKRSDRYVNRDDR